MGMATPLQAFRNRVLLNLARQRLAPHPLEHSIFRFVLLNCTVGFLLGIGVAAAILFTDTAGLWSLVSRDEDALTPLLMVYAGFGSTFGGLSGGAAVMLLPTED